MADSTLSTTMDSAGRRAGDPGGVQPQSDLGNLATPESVDESTPCGSSTRVPSPSSPARNLATQLENAERLLVYAAEAGIDVEVDVRNEILSATTASKTNRTDQTAANALAALTKLAAKLRPVTAESLSVCADTPRVEKTVRSYRRVAIILAAFIIPFSLVTFVTSALSEAILKDIDAANTLAVKLSEEIGPPQAQTPSDKTRGGADNLPHGVKEIDVIRDLQTFAATIRTIDARARQLDVFAAKAIDDPFKRIRGDVPAMTAKFELPSDLPDLSKALTARITAYQEVRYFAQSVRELISTLYGAIAAGILPVLYALLGACAYLLRLYQEQIRNRTFTTSDTHVARFVIAAIGGGVVGLFKNFSITDGASISPLAIAFLVGYAADVFFSFLDAFVQTFNRGRSTSDPQGALSKEKA